MDDTTSRQQIDELADLYLTDPTASPVEGPEPIKLSPKVADQTETGVATDTQEPDPLAELTQSFDDGHPVLRLTDEDSDPASDADDVELLDTPSHPNTQEKAQEKVSDTFSGASAESEDEPAPRAMLEAVLMGHLPGMSGPWLTQYAQLLAQGEGPVVLLHVGEEAIDLELVEPRAEAQPAPAQPAATVRIPPMRGNKTGLVGLIDALVRSDSTPARTVLVRFDAFTDAQTLSRLKAIDDWTLLCGSDDASIASATRQLRAAVHHDPRLADRGVGVMVMGSDEDAAERATRRIADELEHDLAYPVESIGHLRRMQPVQVRDLGSFPDPVSLWPKLVGFFESLEMPEPIAETESTEQVIESSEASEPSPAREPVSHAADAREPDVSIEPKRVPPKPIPPRPARKQTPQPTQSSSPAASRPEPMPRFRSAKPKPPQNTRHIDAPSAAGRRTTDASTNVASEPAAANASAARRSAAMDAPADHAKRPRATATDSAGTARATNALAEPTRAAPAPRVLTPRPELDLVALIAQGPAALSDPAPLDARVPDQPESQLVVDAEGTVHILARHESDATDARSAVMQLIEAGQWVSDHLELIALTQRDRDFLDTPPTLHLLTDRADLTTQIVGKLAGQVRLHLLQQVRLGRENGWFCTPLG
jgi:hypothetical protein